MTDQGQPACDTCGHGKAWHKPSPLGCEFTKCQCVAWVQAGVMPIIQDQADRGGVQQLIEKWRAKAAQVERDIPEAEAKRLLVTASNLQGRVFQRRQCADELEAALQGSGASPQEQVIPAQGVPVWCAHCEMEIEECPNCGKQEWRLGSIPPLAAISRNRIGLSENIIVMPGEGNTPAEQDHP